MSKGTALVTGASSGIGAAFARALLRRNYRLVLVARRRDRLESIAADSPEASIEVLIADLTREGGVAAVIDRLKGGPIDLLVNNAGVGYRGLVSDQPDAGIVEMVRLNLETPIRLTRAALPSMLVRKAGVIVNVASMGAFQPVPYLNVYAATKAGLLSFTEALVDELSGSGVRVQALCPGNVQTEFQAVAGTAGSKFDRTPRTSAEDVAERALNAVLGNGASLHLPSVLDRFSVFGQRVLPRAIPRRIAARLMKPE